MNQTESAFIGLGANLNDPIHQVQHALKALSLLPDSQLVQASSLYGSKPLGPKEQPDYVNAVAELATRLTPEQLLSALQRVEQEQGRQRKALRWGPRTLDLDIILYGDLVLNSERLTIPHYHFKLREFVLYPLAEIAPQLILPDGTPLQQLLKQVPQNGLERLISAHN